MSIINNILSKVVGSRSGRQIKKYAQTVSSINALEKEMQALSDNDLSAKTAFFRQQLEQGATIDSILVEAFAVVREASQRELGLAL